MFVLFLRFVYLYYFILLSYDREVIRQKVKWERVGRDLERSSSLGCPKHNGVGVLPIIGADKIYNCIYTWFSLIWPQAENCM